MAETRVCALLSCFIWVVLSVSPAVCHGELMIDFYNRTCPGAESTIREQVLKHYQKRGNTAVSWLRLIFHDCIVQSCDASILLDSNQDLVSEKSSERSFGMRNFKYIEAIKAAVEEQCPGTVSCADIIVLAARDGISLLGGPSFQVKTGRRDSRQSSAAVIENYLPLHNDTVDIVLSRFQSIGIDAEGTVALLGAHTVGRTHCVNIVQRLYPSVDPMLDPEFAEYLKQRCPTANPDPEEVLYCRNDRGTPMQFDNNYYRNILSNKGLLQVDQRLVADPRTSGFVEKMAEDNQYFFSQFQRAFLILSENNPLTGDEGEIRRNCRTVN